MSEYRPNHTGYSSHEPYRPPRRQTPPPNPNGGISWFWIIMAWMFFWPLGLVLTLKKLSDDYAIRGSSSRPTQTYQRPAQTYQPYQPPVQQQTYRPQAQQEPAQKKTVLEKAKDAFLEKRKSLQRLLTGFGIALTGIGALGVAAEIGDIIGGAALGSVVSGLLIALIMFLVPGVVLLGLSKRVKKQLSLYRQCVAIVGDRKVVRLKELASVSSATNEELRGQIEDLLEAGALPGAYIDYSRDLLVLSTEGLEENELYKAAEEAAQSFGVTDENAYGEKDSYIRQIRQLNDEIADPELSRKIDRIEEITTKMFEAVERDPSKRPQIATFLSYYLPTTLKILAAYRDFENGTAHGANITSAMRDIEGITDTLVRSFERQLDQLFENDALDVTTDISVLENMLAKDGLSQEESKTPHLTL